MRKEQYALYRGDELVDVGTREEVAARQGIKPSTVSFYASPSYRMKVQEEPNRVIAVRVGVPTYDILDEFAMEPECTT